MAGRDAGQGCGRRHMMLGAGAFWTAAAAGAPAWGDAPAPVLRPDPERPDREMMVPVPGGRVYVRVNGRLADGVSPGAPLPVVFVHGGPGGNHAAFLNALPLADDRPVILYDQLDSGLSDHPGDPRNWTVPRFVAELEAIRTALGIPRWHVCGHSWGGTVALEYAGRRPPALAGLVLGAPLVSTRIWLRDAAALRDALPADPRATLAACEGRMPPAAATCDRATDVFYAHYLRRRPPSALAERYRQAHGGLKSDLRLYETMWGRSEFSATGTLRTYDGTPLLARLDGRRVLFMVGQYDEVRVTTAERFVAAVPGAGLTVIADAGHATFSDAPAASLGALRDWLAGQDTMPA